MAAAEADIAGVIGIDPKTLGSTTGTNSTTVTPRPTPGSQNPTARPPAAGKGHRRHLLVEDPRWLEGDPGP